MMALGWQNCYAQRHRRLPGWLWQQTRRVLASSARTWSRDTAGRRGERLRNSRQLVTAVLTVSCAVLLMLGSSSAKTASAAPQATTKKASSHKSSHKKAKKVRSRSWKRHGQQGMESQRVRQIQQALIRERYLSGEPTGVWDQRSRQAMTRYQADNGWQSKITPDSRALIKLGLGPDHADLINPDTALLQPGGGAERQQQPVPQSQPNKQ